MSEEKEFPLEAVPAAFHSFIVEKLIYEEFAKFNIVSKFSSKMCEALPTVTKQHFTVNNIKIRMDGNYLGLKHRHEKDIPFGDQGKNKIFHCDYLTIEKEDCLEDIEWHGITANSLQISNMITDSSFIENAIKMTKPHNYLNCAISKSLFLLPDVKTIHRFHGKSYREREIDDNDLLTLKSPFITLENCPGITTVGIYNLLLEWVNGQREIGEINITALNLDERSMKEQLGEKCFEDGDAIRICRRDDHEDCVNLHYKAAFHFLKIYHGYPCPKHSK